MEVIATHVNADFDALASMLAARKLYPDAQLVIPGAQEKNVRDFLRATPLDVELTRVKNIPLGSVTRLIIVDTKLAGRIGELGPLVNREGVDLHLYDHHPQNPRDIRGSLEVLEEVGACATIFVELLQARAIPLTPREASIMMLGIYEDTGMLTFSSTTPRDLRAAAWLLDAGANLNLVSDFLSKELSPEQVMLLDHLIIGAERYLVNGVEVVVTTSKSDGYVGDLAVLVHKLKDMENLNVVFALILMEGRIYLIARSRIDAVDVGEICHRFGGGGHPTAASATIHNGRLGTVKRRLLALLKDVIPPVASARDVMVSPVKAIESGTSLEEARKICVRQGINYLPVLREGLFSGIVTLETIEKVIYHGLGSGRVDDYMESDVPVVSPSSTFQEIESLIVRRGVHFVPVLEGGKLLGAITMREFLRILHDDMVKKPLIHRTPASPPRGKTSRNVSAHMHERLPAEVLGLLKEIGQQAFRSHTQSFLVGGMVRDLIIGSPTAIDLDVVIEGDAISFTRNLSQHLGARFASYPKFGTAAMTTPAGMKIDFATARTEYYAHPAAYPTVESSSIQNDLYRRDFTINALAVALNPQRFGTLLDFFGGWNDLQRKTIRVLHPLSFVEDPTRIYRAVRLEQRLGFTVEEKTERLIHLAVRKKLMYRLSGRRIFDEVMLILKEPHPLPALRRLHELKVLGLLHPSLQRHRTLPDVLVRIPGVLTWFGKQYPSETVTPWLVYLWGLFDRLTARDLTALTTTLQIPPAAASRIVRQRGAQARWERIAKGMPAPDALATHRVFRGQGVEEVLIAAAKAPTPEIRAQLEEFLARTRLLKVSLTGRDLKALGLPPGPLYSRLLERVLDSLVQGAAGGREREMAMVRSMVSGTGRAKASPRKRLR